MQTKLRRASANDAVMFQLTMVLAAYEERTSVRTWRGDDTQKAYFRFLRDSCGYTLSPVERLVLDPSEDIQRWPHLQETTGDTTAAGAAVEEEDLPDSELDGDGANGGDPAVIEVDADEDTSNLPGAADEAEQVESLTPSVA